MSNIHHITYIILIDKYIIYVLCIKIYLRTELMLSVIKIHIFLKCPG